MTTAEEEPDFCAEDDESDAEAPEADDTAASAEAGGADGVAAAAPTPEAPIANESAPTGECLDAEVEVLPFEADGDGWMELLRDGYFRQLREENEYREPPPFHRATYFAAEPGQPTPIGKYPRAALNQQLQLLLRSRMVEGVPSKGVPGKAVGKGSPVAPPNPLVTLAANFPGGLPGLLAQMQSLRGNMTPQALQQTQLLLEAAKLMAAKGGAKGVKGDGRDGRGKGGRGRGSKGGSQKGPY